MIASVAVPVALVFTRFPVLLLKKKNAATIIAINNTAPNVIFMINPFPHQCQDRNS